MTLANLMEKLPQPDPGYAGIVQADDFVLAVDLADAGAPAGYLVAQEGITGHSGSLDAETVDSTYIRTGKKTTKTAVQRRFAVSGDLFCGDAFQDALLSHKIKYGTGQAVIKDYVYFNILSGIGEKGRIDICVEDDPNGEAGGNAGFTATLYAKGAPEEFTYSG